MQIKIAARHGHIAEETQQVLREKAEKLLRFFGRLTSIEITVELEDSQKTVEVLVAAEHKHDPLVARETNPDILTAMDMVVEKLERQIRRYKEKIQDHRRRPSAGEGTGTAPLEGA